MQMVMSTRGNGSMIKLMGKVFILTLMVLGTRVIGRKTSNMVRVLKDGQMVHLMKDSM
jgi:hypothetical protein